MVASYTPDLRLTRQGDGDNPSTWGQVVNGQVIALIEEAIAGVATVDVTGVSDVNIASSVVNGGTDSARHAVLELSGSLGADIFLIVPSVDKIYIVKGNHTGGVVKIKPSGGGSYISINPGDILPLYTHGTSITQVGQIIDVAQFLAVSNNLSDLTSASLARTHLGLADSATTTISSITGTILQAAYPVGSLYLNANVATNPATLLGFGTWVAFSQGEFLLGTDNATYTPGATGGEATHTLVTNEIPSHTHNFFISAQSNGSSVYPASNPSTNTSSLVPQPTSSTGGGAAHNNMPPYIVIYIWRRTA